jgi:hypothetical protein
MRMYLMKWRLGIEKLCGGVGGNEKERGCYVYEFNNEVYQ